MNNIQNNIFSSDNWEKELEEKWKKLSFSSKEIVYNQLPSDQVTKNLFLLFLVKQNDIWFSSKLLCELKAELGTNVLGTSDGSYAPLFLAKNSSKLLQMFMEFEKIPDQKLAQLLLLVVESGNERLAISILEKIENKQSISIFVAETAIRKNLSSVLFALKDIFEKSELIRIAKLYDSFECLKVLTLKKFLIKPWPHNL